MVYDGLTASTTDTTVWILERHDFSMMVLRLCRPHECVNIIYFVVLKISSSFRRKPRKILVCYLSNPKHNGPSPSSDLTTKLFSFSNYLTDGPVRQNLVKTTTLASIIGSCHTHISNVTPLEVLLPETLPPKYNCTGMAVDRYLPSGWAHEVESEGMSVSYVLFSGYDQLCLVISQRWLCFFNG